MIRMAIISEITLHLQMSLTLVQMSSEHHTWMSLVAPMTTAMDIQMMVTHSMMTPTNGLMLMEMDILPM